MENFHFISEMRMQELNYAFMMFSFLLFSDI